MIEELKDIEHHIIEEAGYMIYDEIGRKQNGDGTWSKVQKQDGVFIVTGTQYKNGNKTEYRKEYNNIDDFKAGSVSI